jgi:EmrB/QacA subfamily drug resistance transporter
VNEKISPKVVGAVVATGLMSFCGVMVETSMNITFPTLMKEFNIATNTVQWMTTLYLLVVAAMVPLSATLKRRFKMRHLFLVAISLFIAGVVLDGLAPAFWVLLLGRGIQGLGTGIALPLMFNIILEQVPPSKTGMMMGVGTMITGVAPALGPTFGGLVVSAMSWRYIFAFLLPVLIIALVLGLTCITQKVPTTPAKIDQLSIGLIIVTFSGLIFGISSWGSQPFISWSVAGALGIGIMALIGFTQRSLTIKTPIINLRLFTNRAFVDYILAFTCVQIGSLSLSFLLPNYIQLVNDSTALIAGLVVLPGAAIGAVAGPMSGRWYDHVGACTPLRISAAITVLGTLGLYLFGSHLANWVILGLYTLFMLGRGLGFGNIMTAGLNQLPQATYADGNAIFNTVQQFAAALGISMAAAIVAAGQAKVSAPKAGTIIGSVHSFAVLLVLSVLELLLIWHVTKTTRASRKFSE